MAIINIDQLLSEIDELCQTQIIRISTQNLRSLTPSWGENPRQDLNKPSGERVDPIPTETDASVTLACHAVGKRKPSLTELDKNPPPKRFSRPR